MSTSMEPNGAVVKNDALPFEVLGIIFQICVTDRMEEWPVETLLLVCRTWNRAARGHPTLWTTIVVRIGHDNTFASCTSHVTRRLALSGPSALLDIDIELLPLHSEEAPLPCVWQITKHKQCCDIQASRLAWHLLSLLAGPDGEGCTRWRQLQFKLDFDTPYYAKKPDDPSFMALSYPMPSLRHVHLVNIRAPRRILPSCPSLEKAMLVSVLLNPVPDLITCRSLQLFCNDGYTDLSGLRDAARLHRLNLWLDSGQMIDLPSSIPTLTSLMVRGSPIPPSFQNVHLPKLNSLRIAFCYASELELFMNSDGIPFSRLQKLGIKWIALVEEDFEMLRNLLQRLIGLCSRVRLVIINRFALAVFLKLLWEQQIRPNMTISPVSSSIFHDKDVEFQIGKSHATNVQRLTLNGKESTGQLSEIALGMALPSLDTPWGNIWEATEV